MGSTFQYIMINSYCKSSLIQLKKLQTSEHHIQRSPQLRMQEGKLPKWKNWWSNLFWSRDIIKNGIDGFFRVIPCDCASYVSQ